MSELFVDASFWFELLHGGRSRVISGIRRAAAAELGAQLEARRRLVSTNLVLTEVHGLLCGRDGRGTARRFLANAPASVAFVWSTPELEARALADWIDRFRDQPFSLCDAVSFAVMRERGIRQVLSFDRHFAAAGFEVLPK